MKTLTSAIILLVLRELCYLSVCINAELAELVQNGNYVSEQKQDVETTDSSNAPLFPVSESAIKNRNVLLGFNGTLQGRATLRGTITQKIDHFDNSSSTFQMRYAENRQFFTGSGPLFILISGEQNMDDILGFLTKGLMYETAQDEGAYMAMVEHRYYGQSIPNGNLQKGNLKFLTVKQVIEDLAKFIIDRKQNVAANKVVVFGGSYSASLAAWLRLVYPKLVDAAVSSSGVFKTQPNNIQYMEVVQKSIGLYPQCLKTIRNAAAKTESLVKSHIFNQFRVKLDYGWNLWDDMKNVDNVQSLFNMIAYIIGNIVQYDQQSTTYSIKSMCDSLGRGSLIFNDYKRFAFFVRNRRILLAAATILNPASAAESISWGYQVCREFGNAVTTDAGTANQPFGNNIPLSFFNKYCNKMYGFSLNETGVNQLKKDYGGEALNVTRVVFTVGSVDPWSGVGLSRDLNTNAPVIVIEGASHCADLLPATVVNSTALANARNRVKSVIKTWLK